jgi:hypothetical protein
MLAVLMVAACASQFTTVGKQGYTPKWHVGDWWVIKTLSPRYSGLYAGARWEWKYLRYDVTGIKEVWQNRCYVVEMRSGRGINISTSGEPGRVLYIRTDKWLVVRTNEARFYDGKRLSPYVYNYPLGLFGPFMSEPRLPRFPLQLANQDTAFKLEYRDYCAADLREISRPADPGQVERLLAEGDTVDSRAIRPTGSAIEVRSELGGDFDSDSPTGRKYIRQSLQLWSDNLPWRLFEELVEYNGSYGDRRVGERSWLVATGRRRK